MSQLLRRKPPAEHASGRLGICLALGILLAASAGADPPYRGRDGQPLPFRTEAEALEFLSSAEPTDIEEMSAGTNKKKRRVTLRGGGVSARAIHRNTFDYRDMASVGFVDSYLSELAAYELSRLLGLDTVPPTVKRKVKKVGALQLWLEGATTEADRLRQKIEPPDPVWFEQQIDMLRVFDNLIANTDRNPGNIIIGPDWRVWYIDHTRSFAGYRKLREPDRIRRCERGVWERLQSISDQQLRQAVEPYARRYLGELVTRRELVVEAIRERIATEGEDAVIFDWAKPLGSPE